MMTGKSMTTRSNSQGLVSRLGEKYGVDSKKMLSTLKATAFRQRNGQEITNEQMMALLVVADQYNLNPFTKEIYAFPDKNAGIVPIVGVDGWARIINEHPQFDGMTFEASEETEQIDDHHKRCPAFITCRMHRKDRNHPIEVTEYLDEVYRAPFSNNKGIVTGPWQSHTKRFLRHKTMIQCARLAFGFTGIYEQDEAERIIEGEVIQSQKEDPWSHEEPRDVPAAKQTLDDNQQNQIQAAIEENGADKDAILSQLGVDSIADIPVAQFSSVLARAQAGA